MTKTTSRRSARRAPKGKMAHASTLTRRYAPTILKPLGRKEAAAAIERALEVVLRDGRVRRDRIRIYGPFLRIEKPKRRGGAPTRLIWVRIRDRDQGVVHEVSVVADNVVTHATNADAWPSFSDEERAEARQLISKHSGLGKDLARKDIDIEWFNPGGHGGARVIGARLVRVKQHRVVEHIGEAAVELDACVLMHESGGAR